MVIIAVKPGGVVTGIYTDQLPWHRLGTLDVKRAAHVEFSNTEQGWTITLADGARVPGSWPTHGEALAIEKTIIESRL